MIRFARGMLLSVLVLIAILGCSSVYKFENGEYILAVTQPASSRRMPKNVRIIVVGDKIEIQNPEHDQVLKGKIEGNKIRIIGHRDTHTIEFIGKLVADNQASGSVYQKSDTAIIFEAEFSILHVNPETKKKQ